VAQCTYILNIEVDRIATESVRNVNTMDEMEIPSTIAEWCIKGQGTGPNHSECLSKSYKSVASTEHL
jgi:hypothetical protein